MVAGLYGTEDAVDLVQETNDLEKEIDQMKGTRQVITMLSNTVHQCCENYQVTEVKQHFSFYKKSLGDKKK